MAGFKRINPGDAANIFVRCILSDVSDLLGGFSADDLNKTAEYFDYKCPYTGEDVSVEWNAKKYVLDHLIPHNRESVGLHLYGNIIITTREINARKSSKSFEEFIRFGTKGTDEEKNARIQKIRNFQKESGYFEKLKNIDALKELCRKEYDSVQNRLQELKSEYARILGMSKLDTSVHQKQHFVVNALKVQNKENTHHTSIKMNKSEAVRLLRNASLGIYGQITFSSKTSGFPKYWANPRFDYIYNDWWLVLNDTFHRILHVFFIPANSIEEQDIVVRADKQELLDIQIRYDDDSFQDSRSKIYFHKWLVKSVKY